MLDDSLTLRDEGLSGFTGENRKKGALAIFIKAVESGLVKRGSYLLVESLDRLSRDTLSEQMSLFMMLVNSGIVIVTLSDQQVYSEDSINSDISRLMISLVSMMRAHEESVVKSQRVRAAWEKKRSQIHERKLSSVCPAWLELLPERKDFRVIEERAAIVRRIYQLNIAGVGHMQIARTLNREGIGSFGAGNGWHPSYLQKLLTTRAVLGEYQPLKTGKAGQRIPAGEPIPDYFPAIIDLPTWQKAQQRRQTSTPGRTARSNGNLFSGIIFDGYNQCAMRHISRPGTSGNDGRPARRWYYLISDYGRLQKGEKSSSWRYEWFESWVLSCLIRVDWSAVALEKKSSEAEEIENRLAAEQEQLRTISEKLRRLADFVANTDRPPRTVLQQFAELEAQELSTKAKLIELEKTAKNLALRSAAVTESTDKIKRLVTAGDEDARLRLREEIRRRIQRIDIFADGPKKEHLKGEHVKASIGPAFKITFLKRRDPLGFL